MEIQYVIINFLILVGIVAIFGKKMILSIFRTRRERIENELNEAENIEKTPLPIFEEVSLGVPENDLNKNSAVLEAKKDAEHKIRQIQTYNQ